MAKKREIFKDRQQRILGYIETMSDNSQQAMSGDFTILAFYDKRKDETQDPNHVKTDDGNKLVELLTKGHGEYTRT